MLLNGGLDHTKTRSACVHRVGLGLIGKQINTTAQQRVRTFRGLQRVIILQRRVFFNVAFILHQFVSEIVISEQ